MTKHALYTPKQVAEILQVTESTLENWRNGPLQSNQRHAYPMYIKIGKVIRYPISEIDRWINLNKLEIFSNKAKQRLLDRVRYQYRTAKNPSIEVVGKNVWLNGVHVAKCRSSLQAKDLVETLVKGENK